ncbi:hypothetical protein AMTR_s05499p00006130, partial [Amborella trichopoda]
MAHKRYATTFSNIFSWRQSTTLLITTTQLCLTGMEGPKVSSKPKGNIHQKKKEMKAQGAKRGWRQEKHYALRDGRLLIYFDCRKTDHFPYKCTKPKQEQMLDLIVFANVCIRVEVAHPLFRKLDYVFGSIRSHSKGFKL